VQVNRPTRGLVIFCVTMTISASAASQGLQSSRTNRIDPGQHIVAVDPRWTVTFPSPPAAPAGFDQRTAYVPLKDGHLIAVDLDNGAVRWTVARERTFAPATGDGFVFAAADAEVVALVDGTGETAWKQSVEGTIAAPVYFDAGMLIVGKADGEVMTLRAQDGSVLWRRSLGSPMAVAPAAAGERLFVALNDHRVVALDRDSGEELWTYTADDVPTGVLALDDQIVIGTRGNRVYSLKSDAPRLRWAWKVGADVVGAAIADDKHIYFVALDNVLRAVHRGNGNLRWTAPLPSRPSGAPMRTGDVVIVPTVSAAIGAYHVDTGKPAFTITAAGELGGVPFLRDAVRPTATRFVAVSREGQLQAFAPRYEPAPVPLDTIPGSIKVGGI
jgi:outer membrane protein assembly factor BamB